MFSKKHFNVRVGSIYISVKICFEIVYLNMSLPKLKLHLMKIYDAIYINQKVHCPILPACNSYF